MLSSRSKAPAPAKKAAPAKGAAAAANGVKSRTAGSTTAGAANTTSTKGKNGSGAKGGAPPPPPPPPPPPAFPSGSRPKTPPKLLVPNVGPRGALLLSLAIFNGRPFKDHWAYVVRRSNTDQKGIMIHAQGDVRNGFQFEIKRNIDFERTSRRPQLVDLCWVDGAHFDQAMWNRGVYVTELPGRPRCNFETVLASVPAPGPSLNTDTVRLAPPPACLPE